MSPEREPSAGDGAQVDDGDGRHYGSYYYENCCGLPYDRGEEWLRVFRRYADRIADEIAPESVLDAGCAMGLLVEALCARQIDAHGIDISSYAISKVHESVRDRCVVGSVLEPFGRRFDLIVTIEVLEHLRRPDSEKAVENFCAHADDILFSSSPFDYKEASHFNVEPPEYWAELFARHGFYRDLDFDASFITRWATRFRKAKKPSTRIVVDYERKHWRLLHENLSARESLMEHQERLVLSEMALAQARDRNADLEERGGRFDAEIARRDAAYAALMNEFHRTVASWSDHAQILESRIVEMSVEHGKQIDTRDRIWAESDRWAKTEIAARDRLIDEICQQKEAAERALTELRSSLVGKLASRLSRLKSWIAPAGSRRRTAMKRITSLGPRRSDSAQPLAPSFAKRTESERV